MPRIDNFAYQWITQQGSQKKEEPVAADEELIAERPATHYSQLPEISAKRKRIRQVGPTKAEVKAQAYRNA